MTNNDFVPRTNCRPAASPGAGSASATRAITIAFRWTRSGFHDFALAAEKGGATLTIYREIGGKMKVVRKIQAGKAVADLETRPRNLLSSGPVGRQGEREEEYRLRDSDRSRGGARIACIRAAAGHHGIGSDGGAGSGFRRIRPRSCGPGRLDARHAGACLIPFLNSFRGFGRSESVTKPGRSMRPGFPPQFRRPPGKSVQDKAEAVCSSPCRYRNSARAMDSP